MRIKLLSIFIITTLPIFLLSQSQRNISLLSHVPLGEDASDIWGYEDQNGIEYAVIGVKSGVKIYRISDPKNPILTKHIQGDNSIWRDMKSYGNFIYGVADQGDDGLLVVNMSKAPDTITHHYVNVEVDLPPLQGIIKTCHNLYIDEDGFVYLAGCNISRRGVIIAKITDDSLAIQPIGFTNNAYSHDVFVNKNLMYSSDVFAGELSIYDITDQTSPQRVSSILTGNIFTHNAWSSEDNNTVYTTDEVEGAYLEAYDISNLNDIQFLDRIRSNRKQSPNVIIHNVHVLDDFLVTSHYTEGVTITDASDPSNLIEVGYFDPFTAEDSIQGKWFDGCWGAYPYFKSGILAISDISNGLYLLQPEYVQASRLEGQILSQNNRSPIREADIYFEDRIDLNEISDLKGEFKSGTIGEGTFNLIVDHPLYDTKITSIDLKEGANEPIIIELSHAQLSIDFEAKDGMTVDQVNIQMVELGTGKSISYENINSGFSTPISTVKNYQFIISKWGYQEIAVEFTKSEGVDRLTFELEKGYEDSFTFDNGWSTTEQASSGRWQRGTPKKKTFGGKTLQPNFDSPFDVSDLCYFTGLQGGGSNSGDVDNGFVILSSPAIEIDPLQTYELSFDYWFSNERGSIAPNDSLAIFFIQEDFIKRVETISVSSETWNQYTGEFLFNGFDNDSFQIQIVAYDLSPDDHVVEAGFDNFKLLVQNSVSTFENPVAKTLNIYPNPFNEVFQIPLTSNQNISIQIFNIKGQLIFQELETKRRNIDMAIFPSGTYHLIIEDIFDKVVYFSKLVKI